MAVLRTGFEGYGGRSLNPAEEVAKALSGAEVAGEAVESRLLPVDYRALGPCIEAAVAEVRPRAVLSLGLWPGEPVLRLERVAVNCADFEIADNKGLRTREAVREGGPAARLSTLPLREIRRRLLDAGIPCRVSGSAGTFLCNALMYHTLDACAGREPPPPAGFVHLPYLPQQVARLIRDTAEEGRLELHQRADLASMDLATMVEAVRIAVATTLAAGPGL